MPEKHSSQNIEKEELLKDLSLFCQLTEKEKIMILDRLTCLASEHEESPALPA